MARERLHSTERLKQKNKPKKSPNTREQIEARRKFSEKSREIRRKKIESREIRNYGRKKIKSETRKDWQELKYSYKNKDSYSNNDSKNNLNWTNNSENFNGENSSEYYNNLYKKNNTETFKSIELSKKDLENFTAMIYAEAGGEGERGMIAVGNVILNRMKFWGKSMQSVLFEKNQFSPVSDGRLAKMKRNLKPNQILFAKKILNGEFGNPIGNATYFQNLKAEKKRGNWQKRARTLAHNEKIIIGNHVFRAEEKYA
ncbi:hypothetical protein D8B46_08930 [Candidatus Gracilibacteria bacterium]|nr:MAG: hypothetical protein D8B46_08930 [Candidatus Gracilibacteria bacterium]